MNKQIQRERFQREKDIQNITKQLRQEMTSQYGATTKRLLLLTSNVSELFQETTNNKKLLRDGSYNITKEVNFLTQKQTNLDHMNEITQQNLTGLFNKTSSLTKTDYSFQIKLQSLSNIASSLHLLKENVSYLDHQNTLCSRNISQLSSRILVVQRYLLNVMGKTVLFC